MHTFFHISLSGSSSSTLALASSAIESCNYNVHQHIRPIQNEKVKIKRCTWDDRTYHNEIALKKSVNQMEENVFGVFRMTLDAHHVVPILEHFDPGPIRPCYHLCFGWELPDLHYYNSPHHIRTQAFMLAMIVWIQVLPGFRQGYTDLVAVAFYHGQHGRHFERWEEFRWWWWWQMDGRDPDVPPLEGPANLSSQWTAKYLIKITNIFKNSHYLIICLLVHFVNHDIWEQEKEIKYNH